MKREMLPSLQFSITTNEVNVRAPLIYMWEIHDANGTLIGRYVGKAVNGDRRPRGHYRKMVDNLIHGLPYSKKKPDGYRRVHRALAQAAHAKHRVTVTYLCNVQPHENIDTLEHHYIQHYNCLARDGIGLNDHPGGRRLSAASPAPAAIPTASSCTQVAPSSPLLLHRAKELIEQHSKTLRADELSGGRGYAFYIGSTRIARISQSGPKARMLLKLAITSRLQKKEREITWTGSKDELSNLVANEIHLYHQHFSI